MSDNDLNKLKVVELRAQLSSRDLDTKGNKAALVKRLLEAINKEKGIVATETPNEEADEGDGDTSQDETLDTSATDISADVEEPAKSVAKTEPVKKDTPKKESVKTETPKKEPPKAEPPKKEPVKTETPKKEPVKTETPKKEPVKTETPKKEPVKTETPKKEPVKTETPKKEPVKTETPKKEPVKAETPKKEPVKAETPKKEPVKAETPKKEPVKAETPKKEPAKVDTPKKDVVKVETPKKDSPKVETAKKDSPKVASPKATTPKKDVDKVETPKKVEIKKEPVKVESPNKEAPKIDAPAEPAQTESPEKEATDEAAPANDDSQEVKPDAVEPEDVVMKEEEEHNTDNAENGVEPSQEEAQPMEEDGAAPNVEDSDKPAQGEKRQRSRSRSADRKKNHSHSRDKKKARSQSPYKVVEDEDDTFDDALLTLDTYNSDLNLCIDKTRYAAAPLSNDGFGFMWAGARATYGFKEGKIAFEVKVVKHLEARRLPEDEPNPHVVRVGFSVSESTLQLGEDPLSYGYGGTGKASCNCEFKDYGTEFKEEDVVTAFLNLDVDPIEISFAKNGEHLGIAYSVPKEELGDKALFPHILSKNCSFEVNFGQKEEPFFKFPEEYAEYTFAHLIEAEKRIRAPKAPSKRDECEMIMLCGLPGAGKTTWAVNYCSLHPEMNYNIIGTNAIIDKMKVMGLSRKRNYHGRWDALIEISTRCLNRILEMGSRRRRNYILDQTNVYASAQRRKMRPFEGFKRRAVVLVPTDEEFKSRIAKREKEEGKDVPDKAVLEMKANFVLPEVGNIFSEVEYVELPEAEAATLIEQYVKEGREAFPAQQKRNFNKSDRRRPPSRFGPPRERGSFRGGRDDRRFGGPPMHGGYGGGHSGRGGPMHAGRSPAQRGHQQRGSFGRGPPTQQRGPPMFSRMDSGGGRGDNRRGGGRGGGGGNGGSSFRGGNKGGRGGDSFMHRDRRGGSDMGGGRGRRDNKFGGSMGAHKSQHYGGGGGGGGGGGSGYNQGFQSGYYNQPQGGYNQQGSYTSPWKNQSAGNAGSYQNYGQSHNYQGQQQQQQQQQQHSSQQSSNPQTSYGYGQQYYNQQWDQWNQQSQQYFNQPYSQQLYNPSQQYSDFSQKPTDRKSRHSRKF